jgi:hypothetical protein
MIRVVHSGHGFYPIPDPGVKKVQDLGSGSETTRLDVIRGRDLAECE